MQDLLDRTDSLGVQPLLSLQRTKKHERITDKLLLLRRHQPSIQCLGRSLAAPIIVVPHRDKCKTPTFADAERGERDVDRLRRSGGNSLPFRRAENGGYYRA